MNKKDDITFHRRIRDLYARAHSQDHKTTRAKFAESCGITKWKLNSYLGGRSEPVASVLRKIAEKQQVSVSWLVGETDIPSIETCEVLRHMPAVALDELHVLLEFYKFKCKG